MKVATYLNWLEASFDWSKDVNRGYLSPEGSLRDRVIKHDIMHLLIIEKREKSIKLKFEDEYANAIVQAVLEGTSEISRLAYSSQCGRQAPKHEVITEGAIRKNTIPQSVAFLTWALTERQRNLPESFRTEVSSEFIEKYINIGQAFRREFKRNMGMEFVEMDIKRLLDIPFSELKTIYNTAQEQVISNKSASLTTPIR